MRGPRLLLALSLFAGPAREEPPAVQALRPDVPEEVGAIVQKMLAKRPGDRYQIPLLVVARLCKRTVVGAQ